MSAIALLRDRCRLPVRVIQLYFKHCHNLNLSRGEIMEILHTVASIGKPAYDNLLDTVRASPVVHADETGGRQDGKNGYFWSFSTDKVHLLLYRRSRSKQVVKEVTGENSEKFEGVLVTDFYAAYNTYLGFHQRCWVHLNRDIDELKVKCPKHPPLNIWAKRVKSIYQEAKDWRGPPDDLPAGLATQERINKQHYFDQKLESICQPYLASNAPMATLCGRIITYLPEIFVFVRFPDVPSSNNNAERIIRHVVVARKISGGTRSEKGSLTKTVLTSLFDTWKLQNLDPLKQCQLLLANYQ
jgi:transposase